MNQTITSCYCNTCGRIESPLTFQVLEEMTFSNITKNNKHINGDVNSAYNSIFYYPCDIYVYQKLAITYGILEVQKKPNGIYYYNALLPLDQTVGFVEKFGQRVSTTDVQDLVKFTSLTDRYKAHGYVSGSQGTRNSFCLQCRMSLNFSIPIL
ncbi:hypothetical protein GVN22_00575 [Cellulophaga sp. BC115SP]|nr:hypothetical protein [Cellulophaga sp. BC115SP]